MLVVLSNHLVASRVAVDIAIEVEKVVEDERHIGRVCPDLEGQLFRCVRDWLFGFVVDPEHAQIGHALAVIQARCVPNEVTYVMLVVEQKKAPLVSGPRVRIPGPEHLTVMKRYLRPLPMEP